MRVLLILVFSIIIFAIFYAWRRKIVKDNLYLGKEEPKYIPKKIFQIISDKNTINPRFQKNIEYIKKTNPNWQYFLYDNKSAVEYIATYYGQDMLRYYYAINPKYGASRADFFRYLLMYREGGVYLDIKSAMEYPLDSVIHPDDEYILVHWFSREQCSVLKNKYGEYQQWHIICRPNHPYLKHVIEKVIQNIENYDVFSDGVGKQGVLTVTGPIAYTLAILPIVNMYGHRLVYAHENIGLVYNNIGKNHENLFDTPHYSKIKEPIILGLNSA